MVKTKKKEKLGGCEASRDLLEDLRKLSREMAKKWPKRILVRGKEICFLKPNGNPDYFL